MKKTIASSILFLTTTLVGLGQNLKFDTESNHYQYSEVIPLEGKTEAQLFNSVKEWASTNVNNFNRRNGEKVDFLMNKKDVAVTDASYKIEEPLKLSDKEAGKNIISVVTKYNGTTLGSIRTIYVNYDLKIIVKDGKIKFEAINFTYNHVNNSTGKPTQISGFKDSGDCASKGSFETLQNCGSARPAFNKAIEWFDQDITVIKESLIKNLKSTKNEKDF